MTARSSAIVLLLDAINMNVIQPMIITGADDDQLGMSAAMINHRQKI